MAVQRSLYTGFVKGKFTPIVLGPNNPQIDSSMAQRDATKKLRAHVTKGTNRHPQVDGPAQRVNSQPGRRVAGAMTIKGGTF